MLFNARSQQLLKNPKKECTLKGEADMQTIIKIMPVLAFLLLSIFVPIACAANLNLHLEDCDYDAVISNAKVTARSSKISRND